MPPGPARRNSANKRPLIPTSFSDETRRLRGETAAGGARTPACAGESRPGRCRVRLQLKFPRNVSVITMDCCCTAAEGAGHEPPRVPPNPNGEKGSEDQARQSTSYHLLHRLSFTDAVGFRVKVTFALCSLRQPLRAARGLYRVGQTPRKCLLSRER